MPRKKIDKLVSFAKDYGAKGLAYIAIQSDGTVKSSFAKFMKEEEMATLVQAMDGQPGDLLLFAADKNKVVWDVLGALRLELARQMGKGVRVKSRTLTLDSLDLVVELRTGKESELVQAISALEGVQNVSLVSHDGEIRS